MREHKTDSNGFIVRSESLISLDSCGRVNLSKRAVLVPLLIPCRIGDREHSRADYKSRSDVRKGGIGIQKRNHKFRLVRIFFMFGLRRVSFRENCMFGIPLESRFWG